MVIIKQNNFLLLGFNGKIYNEYYSIFHKNNIAHRYFGPAVCYLCSSIYPKVEEWWFNDIFFGASHTKYSQKQFIKDINKQWLF